MSDTPKHKSSIALDEQIAKLKEEGKPIPPALINPRSLNLPNGLSNKITAALQRAQEDKDIFLGRKPPRFVAQPNPAIGTFQHNWKLANMNNNRELGPGDTSNKNK